jgi:hypothetical protein
MRTYLIAGALMLTFALTALAQEKQKNVKVQNKPNLNGEWVLDRGRSNVGRAARPDLPVKITHQDPELKIKYQFDHGGQIVEREFSYYTDGRGETNPATMFLSDGVRINARDVDKQVTKSKTRWSGNKLVTRFTLRSAIAGHILEFDVIEEWRLSDDGKTLTQTSRKVFRPNLYDSVFVPANAPDAKKVFSRIPD